MTTGTKNNNPLAPSSNDANASLESLPSLDRSVPLSPSDSQSFVFGGSPNLTRAPPSADSSVPPGSLPPPALDVKKPTGRVNKVVSQGDFEPESHFYPRVLVSLTRFR